MCMSEVVQPKKTLEEFVAWMREHNIRMDGSTIPPEEFPAMREATLNMFASAGINLLDAGEKDHSLLGTAVGNLLYSVIALSLAFDLDLSTVIDQTYRTYDRRAKVALGQADELTEEELVDAILDALTLGGVR